MKTIFTFISLMIYAGGLSAGADNFIINGKVLDNNNIEIPGAAVVLKQIEDSTIIYGGQTYIDGTFALEKIPAGNYFLEIRYLGYNPQRLTVDFNKTDDPMINIGTVRLTPSETVLKEFEISADKAWIENASGKTTVSIERNPLYHGDNLLEVIEKMPGVSLNKDGTITINGQTGAQVLIDGKNTYLQGQELQNLLKSYLSSAIQKIEVSSNGSAKNEASGKSGIINIITAKNRLKGINGNVNLGAGQGKYSKSFSSLMLGFKEKKLSLLFSYSFNARKGFSDLTLTRQLRNGATTESNIYSDTRSLFPYISNSPRLNLDYDFNESTSISVLLSGIYNNFKPYSISDLQVCNAENTIIQRQRMTSQATDRFGNWSVSNELRHIFDSAGKQLAINIDYFENFYHSEQNLNTEFMDEKGFLTGIQALNGYQNGEIKIGALNADYTHPFSGQYTFESGIKTSWVNTENDNKFYRLSNYAEIYDTARSNLFIYDENINAAYINFSGSFKRITGMAGLRVENYNLDGEQRITSEHFFRSATQVFPSLAVDFGIDAENKLSFNAGRRIERPQYKILNPFRYNIDATSYDKGNPNLRPQLISKAELTYSCKNQLFITAGFSRTKDYISQVILKDKEENSTLQTFENAGFFNYSFSGLTFSKKLFGIVKTNNNVIVYYGIMTPYPGYTNSNRLFSYSVSSANAISLGKNLSLDISARYNHRYVEGFTIMRSTFQATVGIQKSFFNDKGNIGITLSDLSKTMIIAGITETENVTEDWRNVRDTRVLNMNLSYRFGNNLAGRNRRITGADAEKSRISQ